MTSVALPTRETSGARAGKRPIAAVTTSGRVSLQRAFSNGRLGLTEVEGWRICLLQTHQFSDVRRFGNGRCVSGNLMLGAPCCSSSRMPKPPSILETTMKRTFIPTQFSPGSSQVQNSEQKSQHTL